MGKSVAIDDLSLLCNAKEFFYESLQQAFQERKIQARPFVQSYLAELLEHYLFTDNLFDESNSSGKKSRETLAEMLLKANNGAPARVRFDLLKKLGDSALYISGFFGDSFQRKVIDVDYYIEMGSTAYISLSHEVEEDTFAEMYDEIARKFTDFVDVFTLMSRKSMSGEPDNVLRLMEVMSKTGSNLAQDQLAEKGIFTNPEQLKKCKNQ